ncbi:MAG: hypothetical protein R2844_19900 [Caldilineales bacterium]
MSLDTALTTLERAQVVRLIGPAVEADLGTAYRFKHSLTQDAAYRSLSRRQRQQVHRQVARCYEELFAGRLDDHAAVLAHHYGEAGDHDKFLAFSQRAGDAALRVYATSEAVAHYERAIEAALAVSPPSGEQLIYLCKQRGRALELASRHDDALAGYAEMERQARSLGLRDMELAAVIAQALLRCTATNLFDPAAGRQLVERATALAEELSDRASTARILWVRCNLNRLSGNQTQALKDAEASLAIARELGLREQAASTLNDMGYTLQTVGDQARVLEVNAEASAYWRETGNQPMLADSLAATVWSHYALGNLQQALAASDESHEISVRIGNVWGQSFSRMVAGIVCIDLGDLDRAWAVMQEALEKAAEAGFAIPQSTVPPQQALLLTFLGDFAGARAVLQPIFTDAINILPQNAGFAYAAWMEILLAEGSIDEATSRFAALDPASIDTRNVGFMMLGVGVLVRYYLAIGDARQAQKTAAGYIDALHEAGLRVSLADVYLQQAFALLALDRKAEARRSLDAAREIAAVELGNRRILWQILAAQAENATDLDEGGCGAWPPRSCCGVLADHAPTQALASQLSGAAGGPPRRPGWRLR